MSSLVLGRLFYVRSFSVFQRATFATQQAVDPIQRAFVEKLREYQMKSKTAEMGLVGASETQIKELKDSLGKLDNVFNAKGADMTQFPILQHKEPELTNPGSSIVVEYPEPVLLEDVEKSERLDDVLTKGPIVI